MASNDPVDHAVRAFEAPDLNGVVSLIERTIEVGYREAYPPHAIDFFKAFHSPADVERRAEQGIVLVAPRDGAIVGTGSLVRGEIFAVFVDPHHQGSGLGRAIMERLEARAAVEGVGRSELSVSLPSRAFYERLGYTMTERRERDLGDGQVLRFWKAQKVLSAPV